MSHDKLASTSCGATKRSSGLLFCLLLISTRWADGISYAFLASCCVSQILHHCILALPVSDLHFTAAAVELFVVVNGRADHGQGWQQVSLSQSQRELENCFTLMSPLAALKCTPHPTPQPFAVRGSSLPWSSFYPCHFQCLHPCLTVFGVVFPALTQPCSYRVAPPMTRRRQGIWPARLGKVQLSIQLTGETPFSWAHAPVMDKCRASFPKYQHVFPRDERVV